MLNANLIVDGDSGSWVIRNGQVCGYIFCRVVGLPRAYMIPIESAFQAIAKHFSDGINTYSYIDVPSSKTLDKITTQHPHK
jgi:hypothetical protein